MVAVVSSRQELRYFHLSPQQIAQHLFYLADFYIGWMQPPKAFVPPPGNLGKFCLSFVSLLVCKQTFVSFPKPKVISVQLVLKGRKNESDKFQLTFFTTFCRIT